jgi:hypothetical protein
MAFFVFSKEQSGDHEIEFDCFVTNNNNDNNSSNKKVVKKGFLKIYIMWISHDNVGDGQVEIVIIKSRNSIFLSLQLFTD